MSLEEKIHKKFIELGKTLAFAESCTGGSLAAKFTALADASKYFLGSLVTYSNAMKHDILDVSNQTLKESGAVSREVAHEMWIGLMKVSKADFGVSITGIAGPSGGTKEKPVGTVYIALGQKGKKPHVIESHFKGNRMQVIQSTTSQALSELLLLL